MGSPKEQSLPLAPVHKLHPASQKLQGAATSSPLLLSLPAGGALRKSKNPKSEETKMTWHCVCCLVKRTRASLKSCREPPTGFIIAALIPKGSIKASPTCLQRVIKHRIASRRALTHHSSENHGEQPHWAAPTLGVGFLIWVSLDLQQPDQFYSTLQVCASAPQRQFLVMFPLQQRSNIQVISQNPGVLN